MARVRFTANLQRHVLLPPTDVVGATVREVLESAFSNNPVGRGYVLDDHGALRKHMIIFVDAEAIHDRDGLTDPVRPHSEIHVMQALSGG